MGSPLSFSTTFDGSTSTAVLVWPGADPTHVVLFTTTPATGFPFIVPSLASHTSTGANLSVPPGWQGVVVVTLYQGFGPLWGAPIVTSGRATFVAGTVAAAVWSQLLPDLGYIIVPGKPVVTDGSGAVAINVDVTTKKRNKIGLNADTVFSGYVDVLAFQPGANPLVGAM